MSILVMSEMFRTPFGSAGRKMVAVRLADFADDEGRGIWPSVDTIAVQCEISPRTVQRILSDFVDEGILICKEKGGGRRTSRYDFDLSRVRALREAAKAATPVAGAGEAGDEADSDEGRQADTGDTGDMRGDTVSPLGCHGDGGTVNEPSVEPSRERERASADEQAREGKGKAGKDLWQTADFQKRINRFVNGDGYAAGEWKRWTSATLGHIAKMAALLDEAELAEAERYRDAFLAKCEQQGVKVPMPVANYFRDRAWKALSQAEMARAVAAQGRAKDGEDATPTRPDGWAISLGPVWSACFHEHLLLGPEKPELAPAADGFWLTAKLAIAWPKLHALLQMASLRRGDKFAVRWHALRDRMEFVPLDSPVFSAWAAEYRRRGWPAMPVPEDGRGAYFPKGGPEGLAEFERALKAETTDQTRAHEAAQ